MSDKFLIKILIPFIFVITFLLFCFIEQGMMALMIIVVAFFYFRALYGKN